MRLSEKSEHQESWEAAKEEMKTTSSDFHVVCVSDRTLQSSGFVYL